MIVIDDFDLAATVSVDSSNVVISIFLVISTVSFVVVIGTERTRMKTMMIDVDAFV